MGSELLLVLLTLTTAVRGLNVGEGDEPDTLCIAVIDLGLL